MRLKKLNIIFDNPVKTYHAGEIVKGRVVVVLDSLKKYRAIRMKIKGAAHTAWSKSISDGNNENTYKKLTGDEEYFSSEITLAAGNDGKLELTPGEHVYNFQFPLPPNLPSSFESKIGYVRYTVKGIIDRPWKSDYETIVAFTVVSLYDLNADSRASVPVEVEKTKKYGCLCCTSPPITVKFSIPVRGFVPGQSIPIKVNIKNESDIEIYKVVLRLVKYVTYRVNNPNFDTQTNSTTITEVDKSDIEGSMIYEQLLRIPALPPSNLNNCGIIDIKYILQLVADVEGCCNSNLSITAVILIGTIPLINYQSLVAPPNEDNYPTKEVSYGWNPTFSGGGELSQGPSPSAPPDYSTTMNLPPPTYEESVFGAGLVREHNESDRNYFTPRYPVYNFSPPK